MFENLLNTIAMDRPQAEQEPPPDQQAPRTGWGMLSDKATKYGENLVDQFWQQHMEQALARGRFNPAQYPVEINIDYAPGSTPVYGPTLAKSNPKLQRYLNYLNYRGGY